METDGRRANPIKEFAHEAGAAVKFDVIELELQIRASDKFYYAFRVSGGSCIGRGSLPVVLVDAVYMDNKHNQAVIYELE
jgi:hypothetical protein